VLPYRLCDRWYKHVPSAAPCLFRRRCDSSAIALRISSAGGSKRATMPWNAIESSGGRTNGGARQQAIGMRASLLAASQRSVLPISHCRVDEAGGRNA